jgi:hypothetical protein
MPVLVQIPGVGEVEYPDEMSQEDVQKHVASTYRSTTYEGQLEDLGLTAAAARAATAPGDRKSDLAAQAKVARAQGETQEGLADALTWGDYYIRPMAVTDQNPFGTFGSVAKLVGMGANYVGRAAANAAAALLRGTSVPEAISQGLQPEVEFGGPPADPARPVGTAVNQGLVDAARMLPTVVVGATATAAGVPAPLAFGSAMYASTLAETQDPTEAAKSFMIGTVVPGVGEAGRALAAKALGRAVEAGALSGGANVPQKIVEAMAAQGAIQVLLEGLNIPEYLKMTPEQRMQTLIRNLVANSAFAVMDVPGIVRKGPSATQAGMKPEKLASAQAGEFLAEIVNDPLAVETLRQAADSWALEATRPEYAQRTVMPGRVQTSGAKPAAPASEGAMVPRETALAALDAEGARAAVEATPPMDAVEAEARRRYELNRELSETVYGRVIPSFDEALARLVAAGETPERARNYLIESNVPAAPAAPVETPPKAAAKVASHVRGVAAQAGSRPAKVVKSELVQRLEAALEQAPATRDLHEQATDRAVRMRFLEGKATPADFKAIGHEPIRISIPGDGDFVVQNTAEHLGEVLKRARALDTRAGGAPKRAPAKSLGPREAAVKAVEIYGDEWQAQAALRRQLLEMESSAEEAAGVERVIHELGRRLAEQRSRLEGSVAATAQDLRRLEAARAGEESIQSKAPKPNLKAVQKYDAQIASARAAAEKAKSELAEFEARSQRPEVRGQKTEPGSPAPAGRPGAAAFGDPVLRAPAAPATPPPATAPPGAPGTAVLFDARLPVSLPRTSPGKVSVPQVMQALEAVIVAAGGQTPIRTGRFNKTRARGVYMPHSEVVRINSQDNIPTATHEIGHASQKLLYGSAYAQGLRGLPPAIKRELVALGRALYGNQRPAAGYTGEGWAEFIRLYVTTDDAAAKAPALEKFFRENVLVNHPEFARAIAEARKVVDIYRAQGSAARAQAQLVPAPGTLRRIARTLRDFASKAGQVDEFEPLWRLSQGYTQRSGNVLAPAADPFLLASWKRGTSGALVETMVNDAMIDPWGMPTGGGSLRQALAPVKGRREEFGWYLFARRALERWSKNQNPGLTKEDAQYLVDTLRSPEFDLAADNYYEWNRGLLEYVRAADPAMDPVIEAILKASNDYAPLARVIDPAQASAAAAAARTNPLARMHGSGRQVRDIFETTIENAQRLVSHAHRKMVLESIVKLSKHEGMGFLVEEVPRAKVRTEVNIEKLRAELEQLGVDTSGVPMDTMLAYFDLADRPKGTDPIVVVKEADGLHWYHVAPEVFGLLNGLEIPRLPAMVDLLLGAPARTFRMGTTGLRASFSLFTNPARDLRTFIQQTQSHANPAQLTAAYFSSLAQVVRAGLGGKASPYVELFYRLGAQMGQPLGIDIRHTKRAARGLFAGKTMRLVTSPIETLRDLLQITESAPRVAELKLIADEVGWKPGQPITPDQAVQMALAAKRVTVDFSAAGKYSRVLNQIMPFYNAMIQGTRSFARALRDRPARTIAYGLATFTIPALLNWWQNKDEEWYRQLPWRERYLYDNVPDGQGNVWQIPRPPEWGNLFSVLPEAMLDSWYRQDPRGAGEALKHILATTNPLDWPVPLRIAKEQWQNRIEFFDRPIIPRSQIDLPPGDQRGPYTTRLAEWIGDAFPNTASPRRIDAAVRGYFGGAVPDLLDALGLGAAKRTREREPADLTVIGRLFRRGGEFSAANLALGDYYEELTRLSARMEADTRAMNQGRPPPNPLSAQERVFGEMLQDWQPMFKQGARLADQIEEAEPRRRLYRNMGRAAAKLMESKPPVPGRPQ